MCVCVFQGMLNGNDRLGPVKAELKCDETPSTMQIARVLASRCKTPLLTKRATLRDSKGSLGPGERARMAVHEPTRAPRAKLMNSYEIDVGADHRLMDWMIRHISWTLNRFQVKQKYASQGVRWTKCAFDCGQETEN